MRWPGLVFDAERGAPMAARRAAALGLEATAAAAAVADAPPMAPPSPSSSIPASSEESDTGFCKGTCVVFDRLGCCSGGGEVSALAGGLVSPRRRLMMSARKAFPLPRFGPSLSPAEPIRKLSRSAYMSADVLTTTGAAVAGRDGRPAGVCAATTAALDASGREGAAKSSAAAAAATAAINDSVEVSDDAIATARMRSAASEVRFFTDGCCADDGRFEAAGAGGRGVEREGKGNTAVCGAVRMPGLPAMLGG